MDVHICVLCMDVYVCVLCMHVSKCICMCVHTCIYTHLRGSPKQVSVLN
jgi:hypothetical protein